MDHNYGKESGGKTKKKSNNYCSVPQCSNGCGNGISLHFFPKDDVLKQQWSVALRIGKTITKHMCVCSDHFLKEDFFLFEYVAERRRLKKGTVPSQKLPLRAQDKVPTNAQILAKAKRASRVAERHAQRICKPLHTCTDAPGINDIAEPLTADEGTAAEALLELHAALLQPDELNPEEDDPQEVPDQRSQKAAEVLQAMAEPRKLTLLDLIKKDADLNAFTGIRTMKQLDCLAQAAELCENTEANCKLSLNMMERIVLTMCKLKLNISFTCISVLFGIAVSTCTSYFNLTIQILSSVLEEAVVWTSKEQVLANMPSCFVKFKRTRVVLDCTETPIEKPQCLKCRLISYSHYKGRNTVKFLIGVSPSGLITYHSPAYGGRASDKAIFLQSNLLNQVIPTLDDIMVDKGFLIKHECTMNGINLIQPPFLGKAVQFSRADGLLTAEIASARVHVERTIQRIKIFKIFSNQIAWNLVPQIDNIMKIVAGIVNLSAPILANDKFSR